MDQARNFDQTLDDRTRRNLGAFYTPPHLAELAQDLTTGILGPNWRDEWVVWDPCCGTKNLTRDHRFRELYCSTVLQSELDCSSDLNPEAHSFQYDFLDGTDQELFDRAPGLAQAIRDNRPILFLLNPPYGRSTGLGNREKDVWTGTRVYSEMEAEGMNGAEATTQFLYRICRLVEVHQLTRTAVCLFSPTSWLTKPLGERQRRRWLSDFRHVSGRLFPASEFPGLSGSWGVCLDFWRGFGTTQTPRNFFPHHMVQSDGKGGFNDLGVKVLSNMDGRAVVRMSAHVNGPNRGVKLAEEVLPHCVDARQMEFRLETFRTIPGAIGTVNVQGNDVGNSQYSCTSNVHLGGGDRRGGRPLTKANFVQACQAVALNGSVASNWATRDDQFNFLALELANPSDVESWTADCVALAALRNHHMGLELPGFGVLPNEFFLLPRSQMAKLLELEKVEGLRPSLEAADHDPHMSLWLFDHWGSMTRIAQTAVRDYLALLRRTLCRRAEWDRLHPERQVLRWDAGVHQLAQMAKSVDPDGFRRHRDEVRDLMESIRVRAYNWKVVS